MKPLGKSYNIFVLLCILPLDPGANKWVKFRNISFAVSTFLGLFFALIASIFFVEYNILTSLSDALYGVLQVAPISGVLYTTIIAHVLRDDIEAVFVNFQKFYDSNVENDRCKFMLKANQRGERIVNFFIKVYAVIYPTVLFMECFGSAIYSQFRYGTITPETLLYPFRVILPWNQKTIAGWLVEVVYSIFAAASLSFINPAFLTFFISICEYHGAFSEMFQHQLNDIDQITRNNAYNITKVKQLLFKTVSMHVSAKNLFYQTAKVYSTFILTQLICSMVLLASSIFVTDLVIHDIDMSFLGIVFSVAFGGLNLYFFCYYGKRSTDLYVAFANNVYGLNWTILPVELQKSLTLMIIHAQKPLFYHGYGIVDLDLNLFLRMLKTVISYYLAFKTLAAE